MINDQVTEKGTIISDEINHVSNMRLVITMYFNIWIFTLKYVDVTWGTKFPYYVLYTDSP